MKVASIAEAKAKLSDYIERCRRETVVFTKHGHPRAALIPIEDDDDLERFLLARNPRFLQLLARSERSGRVSLAEAERLLGTRRRRPSPVPGRGPKRSKSGRALPVPDDPIASLRGTGKRGAVRRLLADKGRHKRNGG